MGLHYDFIIVGSGVSGGRIAGELAEAGANCLLLEAGKDFRAQTFPGTEIDTTAQMFWGGGIELNSDASIGMLRGKCLGGTSVINQALLDRFDEIAFSDWRDRSGVAFLSLEKTTPFYDELEKKVAIQSIEERYRNKNAQFFKKGFDLMGLHASPLRRAQTDCKFDHGSDCIACLGGCPRNSKQSSLVTSIIPALQKGLALMAECEVQNISSNNDQVEITAIQNQKQIKLTAHQCILAGGSFGNTKILFQSGLKQKSPALGTGFSCHPQLMSFGIYDEPIDAHKGPLQSYKSDDLTLRRAGYKFENVAAPPIGTSMLLPGWGLEHLQLMKKYRYLASIEVCTRDEPNGTISVGRSGKIKIHKPLTTQDHRKIKEGQNIIHEIFIKTGAKKVIISEQTFGLHLMGGCTIGVDAKKSVVNPEFELHEMKNVYCADSSIFPSAPGINPSFTIMALSLKLTKNLLRGKA